MNTEYSDLYNEISDQEFTPRKIMEMCILRDRFNYHIETIAGQYAEIMGEEIGSIEHIGFEGDMIEISGESYHCGCCGPDYHSLAFPTRYLWELDWEEEARQARQEKNLAAVKKRLADEAEAAARAEAKERAKFEELKAKFG